MIVLPDVSLMARLLSALESWFVRVIFAWQNLGLKFLRTILFDQSLKSEPRTILVYRTARLGDFIVAIPALVALRRRFPKARIALMTITSTMPNMQKVTNTYTGSSGEFDLPWLAFVTPSLGDETRVLSMSAWRMGLEQARQLVRELKPEVAFVLPFSGEGGLRRTKKLLFLWLAGIRCPVYGWRVRSDFSIMREAQFRSGRVEHQVWGPLHAIAECSLITPVAESEVSFQIAQNAEAEVWAEQVWVRQGWNRADRVVAIFPGGTFPHKRWPTQKFVQLCESLQQEQDLHLIILGAASDSEACVRLTEKLNGKALNLVGQTSLHQMVSVLRRCCLFVGNDSGPAHLASAVGGPCVTLTSSIEYPGWWEPWNSRRSTIRYSVPCEHCFSYTDCPLGTRDCIERIEVSKVLAACYSILREPIPRPAVYTKCFAQPEA